MSWKYVPGETAYALAPLTASELRRLGDLVREIHDAAESFKPPPVPQ
jgi:Ser/Thr protein kinase RdoA (MazF antagonist)